MTTKINLASNSDFSLVILIPTFNRQKKLARAVDSIKKQTSTSWKVIVSNNASTDTTFEYLEDLKSDPRFTVYTQYLNHGAFKNISFLANVAPPESLCAYLSDDDYFLDITYLERVEAVIKTRPDVSMIYGGRSLVDPDNTIVNQICGLQSSEFKGLANWTFASQKHGILNISGIFMKRSYIKHTLDNPFGLPAGWGLDTYMQSLAASQGTVIRLSHPSVAMSICVQDNQTDSFSIKVLINSVVQARNVFLKLADTEKQFILRIALKMYYFERFSSLIFMTRILKKKFHAI